MKRTIDLVDDICAELRPAKRLSMLHNTPKQWKEQRKSILKLSKSKLRAMGDIESNLRKSVLINNTYKKMHRELKEQCPIGGGYYSSYGSDFGLGGRSSQNRLNSGYISMAKEDLEDYMPNDTDTDSAMGLETDALSLYVKNNEFPSFNNSQTNTDSDDNPETHKGRVQNEELQPEMITDENCNAKSASDDTDKSSHVASVPDEPKPKTQSHLANITNEFQNTKQQCSVTLSSDTPMDTGENSCQQDIIDLTVKDKVKSERDCYGQERDQSPLKASRCEAKLGQTECAKRPCEDGALVCEKEAASPCVQGHIAVDFDANYNAQHKDLCDPSTSASPGQLSCIDSDLKTEVNVEENSQEQCTASQVDDVFSLCKYASQTTDNKSAIYCSDRIRELSSNNLVSIIATREYFSTPTSTFSTQVSSSYIPSSIASHKVHTSYSSHVVDYSITSRHSAEAAMDFDDEISHLLHMDDNVTSQSNQIAEKNDTSSEDYLYCTMFNCDIDANQHNLVCFQHFNMAVACS